MTTHGVALLGVLGVTLGPGLLVARLALPSARLLDRVVVALPVSIGLWWIASLFVVAPLVGRSWALTLVVAVLTVYTLASTGRAMTTLGRRHAALLVAVAAVALLAWWPLLTGAQPVPSGVDAVSHGVFASRIAELGTLDPAAVLGGELGPVADGATYHPLGAHLVSVVGSQAAGVGVASGLQSLVILCGAVYLPYALAAITRLLTGDDSAAWLAAAAGVLLPPLALHKLTWGGMPTLLGMACIAAVLVLVARLCQDTARAPRVLELLAVAVTGLVSVQTRQALTAMLLTAGVVVIAPWGSRLRRAATLTAMAGCAGTAVLAAGAWRTSGSVTSAITVRSYDESAGTVDATARLLTEQNWTGQNGLPFFLLVGYGLLAWYRHRLPPLWPVALLSAVVMALAVTLLDWSLLRLLTSPWYSTSWRLTDVIVVTATPIAAFGGVEAVRAVRRHVRGGRDPLVAPWARAFLVMSSASAVTAVVLLALVAGQAAMGARPAVALAVDEGSPVGPDELATSGSWPGTSTPANGS